MPEFIESGVRELRNSSSDELVTLLLGGYGHLDELRSDLESFGVHSIDEIGATTLMIEVEKSRVDDLCELETVASVELDTDDVLTQDESNLASRPNSMM
jgi:hypothetical protein